VGEATVKPTEDASGDPGRLAQRAARREAWSLPVAEVRFARQHAKALDKLGIRTIGDLIRHLPNRHMDLSTVVEIAKVKEGETVTVSGVVRGVRANRPRPKLSVVSVALFDGSGYMFGTWFNQAYVADRLTEGTRAVFSGTVRRAQGRLEMNAPFFEVLEGGEGEAEGGAPGGDASSPAGGAPAHVAVKGPHAARIIPIHPTTAGLSTTWVRRLVFEALEGWGDVPDPLPPGLRVKRGLAPLAWSLRQAHFPDDEASRALAWNRLAYEELLFMQLALASRRAFLATEVKAPPCPWPSELGKRYVGGLPWVLTGDQAKTIEAIGQDMARPHPMNRMLFGEVGSGKTVVATAAMLGAVGAGSQAAMMAPTEVLAEQYARRIGPSLDDIGVSWARLAGSTKAAEKKRILAGLASGDIQVAFGTHALIEGGVTFAKLALAVVDEQHRFGVRQRLALASKGKREAPHVLVMTATPIPRTLAMTVYGDLDVSVLKERPGGDVGSRVTTKVLDRKHRAWAYDLIKKEVKAGRQAYVVCPIVDESDTLQVRAATKEIERLADKEFWGLRLGLLHGRLASADKEGTMRKFAAGELDILVATTVIEVGVDVQNATVMLIEDAERFGLAQLHQLRGRVGRGEHHGWCLLFADPGTEEGKARMEAIATKSDGFELAELDLKIRGPGELFGTRQSGMPDLKAARLGRDAELISWAQEDARALVAHDARLAAPRHAALAGELEERFAGQLEWLRA
jgi:ATP-dependent DNA helicase RecG